MQVRVVREPPHRGRQEARPRSQENLRSSVALRVRGRRRGRRGRKAGAGKAARPRMVATRTKSRNDWAELKYFI